MQVEHERAGRGDAKRHIVIGRLKPVADYGSPAKAVERQQGFDGGRIGSAEHVGSVRGGVSGSVVCLSGLNRALGRFDIWQRQCDEHRCKATDDAGNHD